MDLIAGIILIVLLFVVLYYLALAVAIIIQTAVKKLRGIK